MVGCAVVAVARGELVQGAVSLSQASASQVCTRMRTCTFACIMALALAGLRVHLHVHMSSTQTRIPASMHGMTMARGDRGVWHVVEWLFLFRDSMAMAAWVL